MGEVTPTELKIVSHRCDDALTPARCSAARDDARSADGWTSAVQSSIAPRSTSEHARVHWTEVPL